MNSSRRTDNYSLQLDAYCACSAESVGNCVEASKDGKRFPISAKTAQQPAVNVTSKNKIEITAVFNMNLDLYKGTNSLQEPEFHSKNAAPSIDL